MTSYEGSEKEELEIVSKNNNNSDVNIVGDSNSDSSDDYLENNEEPLFDKDLNEQVIASPKTPINSKLIQAIKIQASHNDDANKILKEGTSVKTTKNLNFLIDFAMITIESVSVPEEPTSFNDAWNHPNITCREKWREAMCKEFADMNKKQVWRKTTK